MPKGINLYFEEKGHTYKDDTGRIYTSATTLIHKYINQFDAKAIALACEKIGRNPKHPKYEMYKGKLAWQLIKEWDKECDRACTDGTAKHDTLETWIKSANKMQIKLDNIGSRIYTVDDIIENPEYGKLNISKLKNHIVYKEHPQIYNILLQLSKLGYYIYPEVGVYDSKYMICGRIDVLCINHEIGRSIILDWKTNKAPITFESGYYNKFKNGFIDISSWHKDDKFFKYPLEKLSDSIGNHYAMQLSIYAKLVEGFGYKHEGSILCHLRPIESEDKPRDEWDTDITFLDMPYLKSESQLLFEDNLQTIIDNGLNLKLQL